MASNSIVEEPECRDCVINIPPVEWPECCIYKVPKQLRKVNEEAYTPKLVSIGPFHHSRKELRDMEMHKLRYLNDFLKRTGKSRGDLLKIIKDNEEKIRHCYSEDPLKIIKDNEEKINHCYSEDDWINDFVQMILLDAIFIIELFLKVRDQNVREADDQRKRKEAKSKKTNCLLSLLPSRKAEEEREAEAETTNCLRSLPPSLKEEEKAEEEKSEEEKAKEKKAENEKYYILRKPWLHIGIYHDLILLENQLPFFVLEKLYMFAFNIDSSSCNHRDESKPIGEHKKDLQKEDAPFVILSRNYFKGYDNQPLSIKIGREVKHFTDFIRYLLCSIPDLIEKSRGGLDNLYSATKLEYAGLKFKAVEKRRLLDITFPENKCLNYFPCLNFSWLLACLPCFQCFTCLEVPRFEIYDSTEALFRNLMALEQCHYPFNAYICNYVMLINYLIKTEKDVDLLVEKKVIVNYIGSNAEVATLFNKLCFQIGEVTSCYYHLGRLLKRHYEQPLNHTLASLRNMYFGDFGRGIATVAALLTLFSLFVPFFTDIGSKRN